MTSTFLPDFHPVITHGAAATVKHLVRDKAARATPEDRMRQRVLHRLVHYKGWAKDNLRLEQSYRWMSDPARTRVRSDIELPDGDEVLIVVECKRGDVPPDGRVDEQTSGTTSAIRSAIGYRTPSRPGSARGRPRSHHAPPPSRPRRCPRSRRRAPPPWRFA